MSEAGSGATPTGDSRPVVTALAAILAAGVALRVAGLFTDFWLDEILSFDLARSLRGPSEVLTRIHLDNNHPLNTLWLWLLGDRPGWTAYRLPALAAGIGSLLVAAALERRRAGVGRLAPLLLLALSPYLVVYSSEARGYAPAAFFALLAWWLLREGRADSGPLGRLAFGAACVLGLLSHLTFLYPWLGLVAVSIARVVAPRDRRGAMLSLVRLQAIPALAFALVWWLDARHLRYAGGPPFSLPEVLVRGGSTLFGGPDAGGLAWLALVAGMLLAGAEIGRLLLAREPEGLFLVVTIAAAPALVLSVYTPHYLDPRYFFTVMPFLLLAAGRSLARLSAARPAGSAVAAALAVAFVAGSLARLAPFLRDGRGHPADAIRFLARSTPGAEIVVGSDHDPRTGTVLAYYARLLPAGKSLRYVPFAGWTADSPEWAITHSLRRSETPPPADIRGLNGRRYRLEAGFPHGGFSGASWFVYRLVPREPAPPGL